MLAIGVDIPDFEISCILGSEIPSIWEWEEEVDVTIPIYSWATEISLFPAQES